MYINFISHYLPETIITNDYFNQRVGLSPEWIYHRTGIKERRKALPCENTHTMAIESVKAAVTKLPYAIIEVDLIVGATYTPYDTIGTLAHYVQKEFNILEARAVTITSACSSFINALEIVEGYFSLNKANKALIVASEHNSIYNDESNQQSGFLWGDGAAAAFISKHRYSNEDLYVMDIVTHALGFVGKSVEGVSLFPRNGGLKMPYGLDVYSNACQYMILALTEILTRNNLNIKDIDLIIPHQANRKILKQIQSHLQVPNEKMVINIDTLGNTGCASIPIALSQNFSKIKLPSITALTVFGGGYSSGSVLLKK